VVGWHMRRGRGLDHDGIGKPIHTYKHGSVCIYDAYVKEKNHISLLRHLTFDVLLEALAVPPPTPPSPAPRPAELSGDVIRSSPLWMPVLLLLASFGILELAALVTDLGESFVMLVLEGPVVAERESAQDIVVPEGA
jgi:hypothetical protein